jgi:hypothetical protein
MKSKIIKDPQMFSYPTCKTGKAKTEKEAGKSKEQMTNDPSQHSPPDK